MAITSTVWLTFFRSVNRDPASARYHELNDDIIFALSSLFGRRHCLSVCLVREVAHRPRLGGFAVRFDEGAGWEQEG